MKSKSSNVPDYKNFGLVITDGVNETINVRFSNLFPHSKLLKALYWMWDAFDRSMINGFVVYETAESIMKRKQLQGDSVKFGVRDLDWNSSARGVLETFLGKPVESSEKHQKYDFDGVSVYLYVFPDDACIRNPDVRLYEQENFNIPNPYTTFLELYGNSNR